MIDQLSCLAIAMEEDPVLSENSRNPFRFRTRLAELAFEHTSFPKVALQDGVVHDALSTCAFSCPFRTTGSDEVA
jgi:hypothetical protein